MAEPSLSWTSLQTGTSSASSSHQASTASATYCQAAAAGTHASQKKHIHSSFMDLDSAGWARLEPTLQLHACTKSSGPVLHTSGTMRCCDDRPEVSPMNLLVPSDILCKTKWLYVMVLLCLPLAMGEPGPCRHSITRNHLLTLRRLIDNQLQNGCSITYTFIERRNLTKCCYVKAALPWILELLTSHFRYTGGSDNHSNVLSLIGLIHNIYSQRCVPQINEELEVDPVSFGMSLHSTPSEALWKVHNVLSEYWELVTSSDPINWRCEREYTDTARPTELSLTTVSSSWESERASLTQLDVDKDLTVGFTVMALSVCGGLLCIITLCCLITYKSHCAYHHASRLYHIPG
ncbi:hypothetical protein DPEC_G00004040 [Dallia pectoralis]|uniref:Uncharacterized protein n=1 Tax=Dallia pectoralis TaxID=75939 RepID=A0ACC2HKH5_DALPE|nr:hypothetical protein DPEC_G00004040 [Dallia pectoralis]